MCDSLRQHSPGLPGLQLRGAEAGPWATAGSTARAEVCTPITQWTHE